MMRQLLLALLSALLSPYGLARAASRTTVRRATSNTPRAATAQPLLLDLYHARGSGGGAAPGLGPRRRLGERQQIAMPLAPLIERGFAVASLDFSPRLEGALPGASPRDQGRDPVPARAGGALRL